MLRAAPVERDSYLLGAHGLGCRREATLISLPPLSRINHPAHATHAVGSEGMCRVGPVFPLFTCFALQHALQPRTLFVVVLGAATPSGKCVQVV